jgi:SWI/SNF-related matrix-associated actin-dependent regulator of chromatin subfamily A member 5
MEEKMVEKQTMKLKLDSLIIQKGRMAPKNTGLQKDDLKDMVNYGADAIFEIGSNIDEEDIEEMIRKGEEKAKNLNQQAEDIMKSKFDMLNFQMDSCNLYQFEDIDYMKEKRQEAEEILKKNVIAMLDAETAELSRRKNKKNLAENNLCPNIYGNGNVGVSNEAKKKRLGKVTDFRFFPDPDRLRELIELEMDSKFSGYV